MIEAANLSDIIVMYIHEYEEVDRPQTSENGDFRQIDTLIRMCSFNSLSGSR